MFNLRAITASFSDNAKLGEFGAFKPFKQRVKLRCDFERMKLATI